MIIVNGLKLLIIITKNSISDVAEILDTPLAIFYYLYIYTVFLYVYVGIYMFIYVYIYYTDAYIYI